mmetsp:Transcript_47298/g.72270  ORF Transcript_47298/g.72270 Transcript_47298/m.72270 type:complete len:223 (-) Transcript_47298:83-751(-)
MIAHQPTQNFFHEEIKEENVISSPLLPGIDCLLRAAQISDKKCKIAITCHRKSTCNGAAITNRSCVIFDKTRVGKSRHFRVRFSVPMAQISVTIATQNGDPLLLLSSSKLIKNAHHTTIRWVNTSPAINEFCFYLHTKNKEKMKNIGTEHTIYFLFLLCDGTTISTSIPRIRVAGHKYETGKRVTKFHQEHYSALCLKESDTTNSFEIVNSINDWHTDNLMP